MSKLIVIIDPFPRTLDLIFTKKKFKELKKLGASEISVVSRGRRDFAYKTKNSKTGYFVEMYFNSSPQILPIYENKLKLDKNVLRSLITKLTSD